MKQLRAIVILTALIITAGIVTSVHAALTGVIAGIITDANKHPIPGVTVTVESENLQGQRFDVSSEKGSFRIPELPPGIYTLKAELLGMQPVEFTDIKISLNNTTRLNFPMELSKVAFTEVVTAEAEVVDVKAATMKATIERDVMERLPGSDDMFTAFSMSGGITGSANVRVHGSAETDNLYLFDGVDTTDPVTATFGANLNADAIEEVEVQTGGFTAEYGRSMGGIVNAVTKSGGNDFHGIFRMKYLNSNWHESYKNNVGTRTFDYWNPTVTFEGPIIRDKIWFMVSYDYFNNDATGTAIREYGGNPTVATDRSSITQDQVFTLPYAKITTQLTQSHKLVLNYSGEDATIKGNIGDDTTDTADTALEQEQGGPFYSMEWTWLKSSNLYFITRAGLTYGNLNIKPINTDPDDPRAAPFFDTHMGQNYNSGNTWNENKRDRFSIGITGNYFVDDMIGAHDFKSGIEIHKMKRDLLSDFPGGATYTINNDPEDPEAYLEARRTEYINPGTSTEKGQYTAFFIQDNWSLQENFTLNLGVRYEMSQFENDSGNTSVPAWSWGQFRVDQYRNAEGGFKNKTDMKFSNMIAPRIGMNWDITSDGKNVMHAYWGRFYNPFTLQLPNLFQPFSADNFASRDQEYVGPKWHDNDRNGIPDEDFFFEDRNWNTTREDSATAWNMLDPDVEAEYTDEFMVGYERELLDRFSLGFTYTHRETNNMLEDVGIFLDADGNVVWTYQGGVNSDFSGLDPNKKYDPRDDASDFTDWVYWVTNVPGNHRDYDGFEVNAKARMEFWDLQASYTYAKSSGSVIENSEGSAGSVSQFSPAYDTWFYSQNLYGELPWSCRHYLKIAGSVHHNLTDWYEISLGVDTFWRSGYHYSKRQAAPRTYDPDATDPADDPNDRSTWSAVSPNYGNAYYFPEGRGTYTKPSFYTVDVSVQNAFKFGKWGNATVILDIINATNNQGIVGVVENLNPRHPELFGQPVNWAAPRTYQLSVKYSF